ncbi:MAG: NCS2 family permease, partial [Clostridia bacterium]|nr:NCS2 family permease [Clostridia bacterium]
MVENQNTEDQIVEDLATEEVAAQTTSEAVVAESKYTGFLGKVDNYFGITKMGSSFKTEILAGITTFMTMVYILLANSGMFVDAGVPFGAIYIVTALSAIVGTLLMAFLAKLPFAQAPGMGLNAFFCYTLCLGMGYSYANALLIVLCSGVLFLLLTLVGARRAIVRSVPAAIRLAIPAGIGLFIAFIGMNNANIVVLDMGTKVNLISFNVLNFSVPGPMMIGAAVAILGLILIAVLAKLKVKASIVLGILGAAILYYAFLGIGAATGSDACIAVFKSISLSNPFTAFKEFGTESVGQVFVKGFKGIGGDKIFDFIAAMVAFAMVDMFDTIGTLMGTCQAAGKESGLIDEDGEVKNIQKALLCDSIATCTGAILGTSTVTTFVESASGVSEGGRTGLTALVVGICFFIAMFLSPIAQLIPSCATASALIYVGILMMRNVVDIDWKDPAAAVPAFLTIAVMPFCYSISYGIAAGFISYLLIKLCT